MPLRAAWGARLSALSSAVRGVRAAAQRLGSDAEPALQQALQRASSSALGAGTALLAYHEALLFIRAHPPSRRVLTRVEAEFRRIARFMKARRGRRDPRLENHGLPWADTVTRYSHDMLRRLLAQRACRVQIEQFAEPLLDLNAVLRLTLPAPEWNETTAGLDNAALLNALGVRPRARLALIVNELSRYDHEPYVKDRLFDALDLFVRVSPARAGWAKAYNRLPMAAVVLQRDLLKRFDAPAWINQPLPPPRALDAGQAAQVSDVIGNSLVLTSRETDPATYLDPASLRLFDLERGLSVAVYAMTADRQLPFESYIGFTLFKNGLPAAYGGSWVLGPHAAFGMNIFEPYRGGESGLMMCQVLRVYRQLLGVRYFEVDAHQFGLDNPDGIATGAFWFYYRHGFRPIDRRLARRAEAERLRIVAQPGHRSSEQTLLAYTGSNLALDFGGPAPTRLFDLTTAITRMARKRFGGDRIAAERACVQDFVAATGALPRLNAAERRVLIEVALLAAARGIDDARRLKLLRRMIKCKPVDLLGYQRLLRAVFGP